MIVFKMSDWQSVYTACEHRHRVVMELLEARSHTANPSHKYREKTSQIQEAVEACRAEIAKLETQTHSSSVGLTRGELSRREKLLEAVKVKEKRMSVTARDTRDRKQEHKVGERKMLLEGAGIRDLGSSGWATNRDDVREDRDEDAISPYGAMSTQQLKTRQEDELAAQDKGLDSLHDVIVRQKRIAEVIGNEVGVQNEILDDLGDNMDQTRQRLVDTTQNIRIMGRRDKGTWKYWLVIVLLGVAIVVLASVPGNK